MNTRVGCSNPTCATVVIVDVLVGRPELRTAALERAGWRLEQHDDDVTPTWYCSRCAD